MIENPEIPPNLRLTRRKYNANASIRKPRQPIKNYLSETISSQNKKQSKYVKPLTQSQTQSQNQMYRTKITTFHLELPTFHLELPENPTPVSKSFYEWGNTIPETYDPYGHFSSITDFGNDPYNHFSE
jgi:hypothetical protein